MALMERDLNGLSPGFGGLNVGEHVLRVAIYYRVSTPGQVQDGYGFDAQKRLLPEYCARQPGWLVVGEYEEAGISGESLRNRPAMLRLLDDVEAGKVDVLLVIEPSRLSRGSLADWEYIKRLCDLHEVTLATPTKLLYRPGNLEDDFTSDLEGVLSKREKRDIARRMARGRLEATQQGNIVSSAPPYGFRFEQWGKKGSQKRAVIHDEEAATVRLVFSLVAYKTDGERLGCWRAARHLTDTLRIPGPGGGQWYSSTVYRLIRNRAYMGEWAWRKSRNVEPQRRRRPGSTHASQVPRAPEEWLPVSVPAIVSEELWTAANMATKERGEHGRGRPPSKNPRGLLASYLRCAHCGRIFVHHQSKYANGRLSRYYRCQTNCKKAETGGPCVAVAWKAETVEEQIWSDIVRLVKSPDLLREIVEASSEEAPDTSGAELERVQRALAQADSAVERVKDAYRAGTYSLTELQAEIEKVRGEREALQQRLDGLSDQVQARAEWEASLSQAIDLCRTYRDAVDAPTPELKRSILEDLVRGVTLDNAGNYRIDYLFQPPGATAEGRDVGKLKQTSYNLLQLTPLRVSMAGRVAA